MFSASLALSRLLQVANSQFDRGLQLTTSAAPRCGANEVLFPDPPRLLTSQIFDLLDHRLHQLAPTCTADSSDLRLDTLLGGLNSFIVAYFARHFDKPR
jgi:hypothetical protein